MRISEITYSKGQTIQLEQFQPVNVHYSAKAEVMDGEDLNKAYIELERLVNGQVASAVQILKASKQTKQELNF